MFAGVGAATASSLLAYAQSVVQNNATAGSKTSGHAAVAGSNGPSDRAEISDSAKLLNELQQLQFDHPPRFKAVALELSHMLSAASLQVTGTQSVLLSSLAAKLQTAADTGSLTGVMG